MPTRLDDRTIATGLTELPDWSRHDDSIQALFEFADFRAAFAFMTDVAEVAERRNHHPDWQNLYNRVRIVLTTHDVGGISDLDLEVAAAITALATRRCDEGVER